MNLYQPHVIIALGTAGTEKSWTAPAGAREVTFQNREGDTNILYYFKANANGGGPGQDGNYFTLQAGSAKTFNMINSGQVFYFQAVGNNSRNLELEFAS
jgi:hypothetical protein